MLLSWEYLVPESEYVELLVFCVEKYVDYAPVLVFGIYLDCLVEHGVEQMYAFVARRFHVEQRFAQVNRQFEVAFGECPKIPCRD